MANLATASNRVHVGAVVDREQFERIREMARREDRSMSAVVRRALQEHLEREPAPERRGAS